MVKLGRNIVIQETELAGKKAYLPIKWGDVFVLTGGKRAEEYKRGRITVEEFNELMRWLNKFKEWLAHQSKYAAYLLDKHDGLIVFGLSVLKGYVGEEARFGGVFAESGELGMGFVLPQDIYGANSWAKSLTAGSDVTLINALTTSAEVGKRAVIILFERGLVSVGELPALQQFYYEVGPKKYPWTRINPVDNVPVKEEGIYAYDVPAFIITQDDAVTVKARATVTATKELRWFGIIFAERPYFASVKWVT